MNEILTRSMRRTRQRRRMGPAGLVPGRSPLSMPDQCYRSFGNSRCRDSLSWPRLAIIAATSVSTALFAAYLYRVVAVPHMTALQAVFLVVSTLSFSGVAFGTSTAVAGFALLMADHSPDTLRLPRDCRRPTTRTALLFPVYHEDMALIAATIDALGQDLARRRIADAFDVFILSDSRTLEARRREEQTARILARALARTLTVYFRWRPENSDRKAGNIRDWVEQFGGAYDHFVIMDADSIMSAEALLHLVAAMEQNEETGLIQTVPRLTPGPTRLTCFGALSSALQGPIAAAGLALWQRESGNYWGHNAIVRTRAFAASAGLAPLPGRPPFGGTILSHDFVEAALLRRAGWEVHLVPSLAASWEGAPPRLGELLSRDRRWAQGNLQHLRLLGAAGVPWVSRAHLFMGAYAYIGSLLWAATLLVGIVLAMQSMLLVPSYFGSERTLFPEWPRFDPEIALPLLGWTMAVVFLPKLLGLAYAWRERRRVGIDPSRLLAASGMELCYSVLVAPILMAAQTSAVLSILARRDGGWPAQRRDGEALTISDAFAGHRGKVIAGLALFAMAWFVSAHLALWMSPVALGLVAAPLTDWWTSRPPSRTLARVLAVCHSFENMPAEAERRVALWRRMLAPDERLAPDDREVSGDAQRGFAGR